MAPSRAIRLVFRMAPDVLGAPRPVERFSSQRPELSSTAGSFPLYAFAVGAILALALLLRLRGITTFSFEQDEIYTMMEGRELFDTPLVPGIEARPLYFLLQH